MPTYSIKKSSAVDNSTRHDEQLRQVNSYILDVVRRKIPRALVSIEVLDLEIDEIAQRTRIKLWLAMQRNPIANLRSYANRIIYTEIVDLVRRSRPIVPLPLDEDGELYQEHILNAFSAATLDPAEQFEEAEGYHLFVFKLALTILALPMKQRYAILCALKEYSECDAVFTRQFARHGLDIAGTHWPQELRALQALRASLSIARKKLHVLKCAA